MRNQFELAISLRTDLTPLVARLSKDIEVFVGLSDGVEKALKKIVDSNECLQKSIAKLEILSNDYEQMLMARASEGVRVNITATSKLPLTNLVNDNTSVTSKVDEATIKKYTKRLRSKYHPDKGGNADNLDIVLKASKSGAIEILYLYLVTDDPAQFEFSQFEKMLGVVFQKKARLEASKAFNIARYWMVGNKPAATALLLKAIETRRIEYVALLSGLAFANEEDTYEPG